MIVNGTKELNDSAFDESVLNKLCIQCMQCRETATLHCPHCGFDECQAQAHPLHLKPRTLLKQQYAVGQPLGQGGFGVTYIGLDMWLNKRVAIKEYLPAALASRDAVQPDVVPLQSQATNFQQGLLCFIEEARNLARFDHPGIVRVLNFFEANQTAYMVMEYLEGCCPSELLASRGRLDVGEALAIVLPILDALEDVHAQHFYHRDISLKNICLLNNSLPVLIDFGAARHVAGGFSQSMDLVLKHGYSPIEQYSGRGRIGPWTDVYACGALLYLLISGELPPAATDRFGGDTLQPLSGRKGLKVMPTLDQVVQRALAIAPEDRFQSVRHFRAALLGETLLDDAPPQLLPIAHPPRSHPLRWKAAGLFGMVFLGMIALLLYQQYFVTTNTVQHLLYQAVQQQANDPQQPVTNELLNTWQALLALAPENPQVQHGIQVLIARLYQQAQNALNRADRSIAQQQANAGLSLDPSHEGLQKIAQMLKKISTAETRLNNADHFLAQGHLREAAQGYQSALDIQSTHEQALAGLQQVADAWLQQARAQPEAEDWLSEGLRLFPEHEGLKQWQASLAERDKAEHVSLLLDQAEKQLAQFRLTEPVGDNALETYQQVLSLSPDEPAAQTGLRRIADAYVELAERVQGNPARQQALVERGLRVVPNHGALLALRGKLRVAALPIPASSAVIANKPADIPVTTPPQPVNRVDNLLAQAQQLFQAGKMDAALHTFRTVITLNPEDAATARQGLQDIADYYSKQAQSLLTRGLLADSLSLVNRGLSVVPEHKSLLDLQKTLKQQLQISASGLSPEETVNILDAEKGSEADMVFTPTF